jgi:NAD(P)H dehydrogenase (quinone)
MLDVLIVFSHPDGEKSINALILQNFLCGLKQNKSSYTVLDLYADNFNPTFSYNELRNGALSAEIRKYHKIILNHKKMVFIYPAWNYGMPAMLKGWIDRVLVIPGFSFQEDAKHRYLGGLLTHEKVLLFQTFGGDFDGEKRKQLNHYFDPICAVLNYCGLTDITLKSFFGLYNISSQPKHKIIKKIQDDCCNFGATF